MPTTREPLRLYDVSTCCQPLATQALSADEAQELSVTLKAIADPARLRLLSLLMASPDGEACTCDLVEPLGLSQPTVTHHLRKLTDVGIVTFERRGVWTYYRVRPGALASIGALLGTAV
jgi:ArsR family transcriptional regulator